MTEQGLTWHDVRDSYSAVLFLETAAYGAEEWYTTANNAARYESTVELARLTNDRTLAAWVGQPHLLIIDDSTDFTNKWRRAMDSLARVLGLPVPLEIERKFRVMTCPSEDVLTSLGTVSVEITQYYLDAPPGVERRIRRREQDGGVTLYYIEKTWQGPGVRAEREVQISSEDFEVLLQQRDATRSVIRKTRHCFVYERQYFELDEIHQPHKLWLLEIELTHIHQPIRLPKVLGRLTEVTDDPAYYNEGLSIY